MDVDGHNFPNLALMRLSAWHKLRGDDVERYSPLFSRPERIYMSKVFTFTLIREAGCRREIYCYMPVKDIGDAETRLQALVELGVTPFAQPYRDFSGQAETTKE